MVEHVIKKDSFLIQHPSFSLREIVDYPNGGCSYFYDDETNMVIIDHNICDIKNGDKIFSYMLITDKQNYYMHHFKRVFRFLEYDEKEIDYYLKKKDIDFTSSGNHSVNDRADSAEPSPLEWNFERIFSNVYGMNALRYLNREYGICDENGKNFFLDFMVETSKGKFAIEENGIHYHHPQLIHKDKYKNQLKKQNTCALWKITY